MLHSQWLRSKAVVTSMPRASASRMEWTPSSPSRGPLWASHSLAGSSQPHFLGKHLQAAAEAAGLGEGASLTARLQEEKRMPSAQGPFGVLFLSSISLSAAPRSLLPPHCTLLLSLKPNNTSVDSHSISEPPVCPFVKSIYSYCFILF